MTLTAKLQATEKTRVLYCAMSFKQITKRDKRKSTTSMQPLQQEQTGNQVHLDWSNHTLRPTDCIDSISKEHSISHHVDILAI